MGITMVIGQRREFVVWRTWVVQMMHRGYPLVSDPKYNPMLIYKDERWCPRSFLHAYSLLLYDEGVKRRIVAPLADDLREALSNIRLSADFSDGQIYSMTGIRFTGQRLGAELPLLQLTDISPTSAIADE